MLICWRLSTFVNKGQIICYLNFQINSPDVFCLGDIQRWWISGEEPRHSEWEHHELHAPFWCFVSLRAVLAALWVWSASSQVQTVFNHAFYFHWLKNRKKQPVKRVCVAEFTWRHNRNLNPDSVADRKISLVGTCSAVDWTNNRPVYLIIDMMCLTNPSVLWHCWLVTGMASGL